MYLYRPLISLTDLTFYRVLIRFLRGQQSMDNTVQTAITVRPCISESIHSFTISCRH